MLSQSSSKSTTLHYNSLPRTQFIGQNICYEPIISSTNKWAAQCLQATPPAAGTVFITDHQYQGQGQRGHIWHSEPGKNLTFSTVLYPTFLSPRDSFALNWVATLALYQVVTQHTTEGVTIKWPNDIYHRDKKLGGVLIDNTVLQGTLRSSILGIGLNVNQRYFSFPGPTSLARIHQRPFDLQQHLHALLIALEYYYRQLQTQGMKALRAQYLKHLCGLHETRTFRNASHAFQGMIMDIDDMGRLIIEHTDGTQHVYDVKEISFVA